MKYIKSFDEMDETKKLLSIKKLLKQEVTYDVFKDCLVELHNLYNDELCEDDDDILSEIQNNLNKSVNAKYLKDIIDSEPTLSEYAKFLYAVNW